MTHATRLDSVEPPSAAVALLAHGLPHVLSRIRQTPVGTQPFHHAFIERIFPDDIYDAVRAHLLSCKSGGNIQDRSQDNPAFTNKRTNLNECGDEIVACIRAIFADPEVMRALITKFYVTPSDALINSLSIHEEFEYFYTAAGRFQNIHVDVPFKYLSFVFYIPENPVPSAEEERNATILYDKALRPHYPARFRANSACIFAPHFSTYHGFSSTIDRDVLVMFYVGRDDLRRWREVRQKQAEEPPFEGFRDAVEAKLRAHPLIAFAGSVTTLAAERAHCLVNAPLGRVLLDAQGRALPVSAAIRPATS